MAADVAGLVRGMELLEPGFTPAAQRAFRVGRLAVEADPLIDQAIDRVLAAAEWEVVPVSVPGWDAATASAGVLLVAEAWEADSRLVTEAPESVGTDVLQRLELGHGIGVEALAEARKAQSAWKEEIADVLARVDLLVTPTLTIFPPPLDEGEDLLMARCTLPVNFAGLPALALPAPTAGPLPASVQVIGSSEEELLAAGSVLEAAAGSL
ncbi:MAG TPA: amidase family protein [Acidimicrobiales bacterium]|nr:amidase family protein [Acidimicrobiales bacterium]